MVEPKKEFKPKKVVVVGAGIAGLSAAHFLRKQGCSITILEKEQYVGGAVRSTLKEDKYLIDFGPLTFPSDAKPILRLARELSIEPLVVGNDTISENRYIYKNKKIYSLPSTRGEFLKSGLVPFSEKVRSLWGSVTERDVVGATGRSPLRDQWLKREKVSSFKWGMGTLTARLEEEFRSKIQCGCEVSSIEKNPKGGFKIKRKDKLMPIEADIVVVAAPSYAVGSLLAPLNASIAKPLSEIVYAPMIIVYTAFSEKDIPKALDGFGVAVAKNEGVRLLGSVWLSALFSNRAPKGVALLANFFGGETDVHSINLTDEEIIGVVKQDIESVMGITVRPQFVYVKRWQRAIPQYATGHDEQVGAIKSYLENIPGLFLTGGYFKGFSVSDTIAHSRSVVDEIAAYLRRIDR